jgi:hypothetical protein
MILALPHKSILLCASAINRSTRTAYVNSQQHDACMMDGAYENLRRHTCASTTNSSGNQMQANQGRGTRQTPEEDALHILIICPSPCSVLPPLLVHSHKNGAITRSTRGLGPLLGAER